ncbi:hypothetical protein GQX74_000140 [Glossina fuscipes]|nr:hypothetical protein GQX74_000140 [Glossina fuscipes]
MHFDVWRKDFDSCGYFIEPAILLLSDINDTLLKEEIFGPVLSIYAYKDADMEKIIELLSSNTPYALTGSVFATDENFIKSHTVGNFYINDKSTGAVVGQQLFGGGKMSGTNNKPGSPFYLLRWTSPILIKETFAPKHNTCYPCIGSKWGYIKYSTGGFRRREVILLFLGNFYDSIHKLHNAAISIIENGYLQIAFFAYVYKLGYY